MPYLVALLVVPVVIAAVWTGWRLASRRGTFPCPTSITWLLDNPFTSGYHAAVTSRLGLSAGLYVLDAGCGPGLLTVPIARAVGPKGRVLALDVQEGMIEKAKGRVAEAGLTNVDFLVGGLGQGRLPNSAFDRALLVTVLGEIPDRVGALMEIYASLKPGGFLSITEVLPDPHYQPLRRVVALAGRAGFHVRERYGSWFTYTVNVEKHHSA